MSDLIICTTKSDLKSALSAQAEWIRVENTDLATTISQIKALSAAKWTTIGSGLLVAIGAAVVALHPPEPTDVIAAPIKGAIRFGGGTVVAGTVISIGAQIGFGVAAGLIALGIAFGGIGQLNSLYHDYDITERGSNYLILKKTHATRSS